METLDIFGSAGTDVNLHLVWTALAGLGIGVVVRMQSWRRWLGFLPLLYASVDHAANNYAISANVTGPAAVGHGSFLTVELGEPETAGGMHGIFHLWVYLAGWRLENATEVIAASEDDREELARKVAVLDGRILTKIIIEQPSLSARFEFDQGLVLATFSLYSADYEH